MEMLNIARSGCRQVARFELTDTSDKICIGVVNFPEDFVYGKREHDVGGGWSKGPPPGDEGGGTYAHANRPAAGSRPAEPAASRDGCPARRDADGRVSGGRSLHHPLRHARHGPELHRTDGRTERPDGPGGAPRH